VKGTSLFTEAAKSGSGDGLGDGEGLGDGTGDGEGEGLGAASSTDMGGVGETMPSTTMSIPERMMPLRMKASRLESTQPGYG
jgi:hypothetical protein